MAHTHNSKIQLHEKSIERLEEDVKDLQDKL